MSLDFRIRQPTETVQGILKNVRTERCGERLRGTALVPNLPLFDPNPPGRIVHEDVVRALDHLLPIAPSEFRKAVRILGYKSVER